MSVRVRYAPSPTGLQHIGGIRTALFNYFFAKSSKGKFILRVEDTDRERYSDESLDDLYQTLDWLGIKWDEGPVVGGPYGPYIQSERFDIYKKYAEQLVKEGKAYYCYCTPERLEKLREEQIKNKSEYQGYDRHCANLTDEERAEYERQGIKPVIRLKVPTEGKTTFHDVIMGDITRKNKDISPDPILLKSDGFPTYHLANVIDDHLMGITHIMRAQEWIPSGPLHVLLYQAFGWEVPIYCHLPMVMGKDGQKLSKRHGSTAVREFREKGYLPEAIINYVTLVGWSLDGSTEFLSKEQLENCFKIENIHKNPGKFDYKKLDWFNSQYIRMADDERIASLMTPYLVNAGFVSNPPTDEESGKIQKLVKPAKERMKVISDIVDLSRFLFVDEPVDDENMYIAKGSDLEKTKMALEKGGEILFSMLKDGKKDEEIEEALVNLSQSLEIKVNGVFQPIRVAITNSQVSLPLFDSISLLGLDEDLVELAQAHAHEVGHLLLLHARLELEELKGTEQVVVALAIGLGLLLEGTATVAHEARGAVELVEELGVQVLGNILLLGSRSLVGLRSLLGHNGLLNLGDLRLSRSNLGCDLNLGLGNRSGLRGNLGLDGHGLVLVGQVRRVDLLVHLFHHFCATLALLDASAPSWAFRPSQTSRLPTATNQFMRSRAAYRPRTSARTKGARLTVRLLCRILDCS